MVFSPETSGPHPCQPYETIALSRADKVRGPSKGHPVLTGHTLATKYAKAMSSTLKV